MAGIHSVCCCCIIWGIIWMCQQGVSSHRGFDIISDRSVDKPKARPFLCSIDHKQARGHLGHLVRTVRSYRRTLSDIISNSNHTPYRSVHRTRMAVLHGHMGGTAHGGWKWRFTPGMVVNRTLAICICVSCVNFTKRCTMQR